MKAVPCILLCAGILHLPCSQAAGQQIITTAGIPVTQDFNSLPSAGSDLTATGSIFAEGWAFLESGTNANLLFRAGTGNSTAGDTYSYGVAGSNPLTDRAFGLLQTTNLRPVLGFTFTNYTGQTISSITIGFTGEVWRQSMVRDSLVFSYQTGDVNLNTATGWNKVAGLTFTTPVIGTETLLDGNNPANRSQITPFTLTGLYLPHGSTVTFRWIDETVANSAGMAVDDFTLILHPAFTGYFRSRGNGDWNDPLSWEASSNGLSWAPAEDVVPSNLSAGITIQADHTVTVSNNLNVSKLTIAPAGKLLWQAGTFTVTDSPGDDLVLQGAGSEWEVATNAIPVLTGSASVRVGPGAVLKLSGTNDLLAFHGNAYTYANEAVCEYSYTASPNIAGTFFSRQDAGAIPIFRYNSPVTTSLGNTGATTINGSVEVAGGRTFNLNGVSGSLVLRNGITGGGNISSTTTIQLTSTTAILGGAGTISSHLVIQPGCITTVLSDKIFSSGRTITINGVLDFKTHQFRTLSGSATLANGATGILKTANPSGLLSENGSLKTGAFTLNFAAGSTVDYTATGNQQVSIGNVPPYQNLVLSGTGIKTVEGGGNLVVQSSCTVRPGATLALTGNASENVYLNNNAVLEVEAGASFDNGGESSITASAGTPSILIRGTFRTRDTQGFTGTGAAIPSIVPVLSAGSTIEYGRLGDQAIQATVPYHHLACSGSGTKTPSSALALNGTVTVSDNAVLNGASHTIGGPLNPLVMTGSSRLVVGVTGTQPAMGGTYSLAPGTTIEFANNNNTTTTIRQGGSPVIQYANIDITGSNMTAPHSGITLQAGATLTVKAGGVLKLTSVNGLHAPSGAAVLTTNSPTLVLEPGSAIEYSGGAQAISTGFSYSHLVISGTGDKTAATAFGIARSFTRSGDASLKESSPVYSAGAMLVYKDASPGRLYTPGLEWPLVDPPRNLTVNLSGTGLSSVRLEGDCNISNDLALQAGALDLNGKQLEVGGNITGMGTLTGSPVSSLVLQGGTSTLRFTQTTDGATNALAGLVVKGGTASMGNRLQLYEVLDIRGGSLDLNHQPLVLKSGPTQTARVAERKGSLLNATKVTVERSVAASYMRRWRLLTAPVTGTSINAAWQEGRTWSGGVTDALSPGYGTLITGQEQGSAATANAAGFDFWPAIAGSQSSVRRYQGGATSAAAFWQPLSSTLATNFNNGEAYLLFVRGDRTVTGSGNGTVLRATGELREPMVHSIPVNTAKSHVLLGNPYASPLNFRKLYEENAGLIQPYFWIWQAGLSSTGGYALVKPETAGSSSYEVIPSGSAATTSVAPVISPGEGFFVVPAATTVPASLVIKQAHKTAESSAISVLRQTGDGPAKLYINLLAMENNAATLLDGVMLQFSDTVHTTSRIGIGKAVNSGENLSVYQAAKDWQVAELPIPVQSGETGLRLWRLMNKSYQLSVRSRDFSVAGLGIWLRDRYLEKEVPLALGNSTTVYAFNVTGEQASRDPFRFLLIYRAALNLPLPVRLTGLKLTENGAGLEVEWEATDESETAYYAVDRSGNGQDFLPLGRKAAKRGTGPNRYRYPDPNPADISFYRLKIVQADSTYRYSAVVKWERGAGHKRIRLFPNPLRQGAAQLQLLAWPQGRYSLVVYAPDAKAVWQQHREHPGGTATWLLNLEKMVPAGVYTMEIKDGDGNVERLSFFMAR